MKKTYILILFLSLSQAAAAQNKAFKARADKAFSDKDYVTAAYYYDQALEGKSSAALGRVPYFSVKQRRDSAGITEVRYRLAESYRLYQNYTLAEGLYKQVIEGSESAFPLARLWYGICLRCNNQLSEAASQLELFLNSNKDDNGSKRYSTIANNELKDCLFAIKQGKISATATIEKLQDTFSTEENDFAVSVNSGRYWFTGTSSAAQNKYLNQIFVSEKDSLNKSINIPFSIEGGAKVHYGTPSLDSAGTKMYFTKWYKEGDKLVASIYLSKYADGRWGTPLKLNNYVNAGGFNSMQPFVTPNGKQLYFVSNRTGGMGGDDIWLSELDTLGLALNAVNLGKGINTAADEQSPYYQQRTKKLVFGSKGYIGMGNFDLYESTHTVDRKWTTPRNLGQPYNSTKDDLYYFQDDSEEGVAYLSSDRASDCCLNLFKVHFVKPPLQSTLFVGRVTDCATSNALSGVSVDLIDSFSGKVLNAITGDDGRYQFKIELKRTYQIRLEKEGYFSKVVNLAPFTAFQKDTLNYADICLQMFVIDKPIVIENVLYDFNKAVLKPESLIVLDELVTILHDNPKIKIELSAHTDSIGPAQYNHKLSQQRAQSCVDYIIYSGISGSRIFARGYGETMPVQPNSLPNGKDNRDGRRLNRRTEFKVLKVD